ncbi:hypothetical protein Mh1950_18580 [Mannheimia haemolytica]
MQKNIAITRLQYINIDNNIRHNYNKKAKALIIFKYINLELND